MRLVAEATATDWTAVSAVAAALAAGLSLVAVSITTATWWSDRKFRRTERKAALADILLVVPGLDACEQFRRSTTSLLTSVVQTAAKLPPTATLEQVEQHVAASIESFNNAYLPFRAGLVLRVPAAISRSKGDGVVEALDLIQDAVTKNLEMLAATRGECAACDVLGDHMNGLASALIACSQVS